MPTGTLSGFQHNFPHTSNLASRSTRGGLTNKALSPQVGVPFAHLSQAVGNVWLGLANRNSVPEFGPNDPDSAKPKPHPSLRGKVSKINTLPFWGAFPQLNTRGIVAPGAGNPVDADHVKAGLDQSRDQFINGLAEARLLADQAFGLWGENKAFAMLQLTGSKAIIQAHDHADERSLRRCAAAWSMVSADLEIRDRLGSLVESCPPASDALTGFHVLTPDDFSKLSREDTLSPSALKSMNFISQDKDSGRPILWVNVDHTKWRADSLLTEAAKLYYNQQIANELTPENIARRLGEPLALIHLETCFALTEGATLHVARQIFGLAYTREWPVNKTKCLRAFEQACRTFGEQEVLAVLFNPEIEQGILQTGGDQPSLSLKILIVATQRFLEGRENGWA